MGHRTRRVPGAATLAKGPAAILLAGGAAILWALLSQQWRPVLRLLNPAVLVSYCIIALPWYLVCAYRNPDFFRIFIVEHNFKRYLTSEFSHPQPFWFFIAVLLLAVMPWTALLIPLATAVKRRFAVNALRDSPALFWGCWAVFPILFFSFSESKLPGYILPSVPPLVFLFAVQTARLLEQRNLIARWSLLLVAFTFPVGSLAANEWLRQLPAESGLTGRGAMLGWGALLFAGGAACAILALAGRERMSITAVAILIGLVLLVVDIRIVPKLDPYISVRPAFQAMPAEAAGARDLSVFKLDRAREWGLDFYLGRELPSWNPGTAKPEWMWTTAAGAEALSSLGIRYSVILRIATQPWLLHLQ